MSVNLQNPRSLHERYRAFVAAVAAVAARNNLTSRSLLDALKDHPRSLPASLRVLDVDGALAAALAALRDQLDIAVRSEKTTFELNRIAEEVIAAEYAPPDSWRAPSMPAHPPKSFAPPEPAMPAPFGPPSVDLTLSGRDDGPDLTVSPVAAPSAVRELPAPERWINAEIEDHPLDEALVIDTPYTLAFDIDLLRRGSAVSAKLREHGLFPPDVNEVTLTVQLGGRDFSVADDVRKLYLPRTGKSRNKARFDVIPKKVGRAVLLATFHRDGNFIHQMEVVLFVVSTKSTEKTPEAQVSSHGRPVTTAGALKPRDVGLSIKPAAGGGYECMAWGSVRTDVHLPVEIAELAKQIELTRAATLQVITQPDEQRMRVFQTGIDIPVAESERALSTLARAGALLFSKIFFHPAAGPEAQRVGNWLRARTADTCLRLQVLAKSFPVPWGMLYVGDVSSGAQLDWGNFLGFRHIIEQIPLQAQFGDPGLTIDSEPALALSINTNDSIDRQMSLPLVADQRAFWSQTARERARLRLTSRSTRAEVLRALGSIEDQDQIAYFYCHADTADLTDRGGPGSSCLVMTDGERITLDDLTREAPTSVQLAGSPLIFINACESAALSPAFYDGFVPYFMAKGARGVIGTECKTPAVFAAEWAKRFFSKMLAGEAIGSAFLALRREFLDQHRNPLGLLYAVYCDGDTQVAPGL